MFGWCFYSFTPRFSYSLPLIIKHRTTVSNHIYDRELFWRQNCLDPLSRALELSCQVDEPDWQGNKILVYFGSACFCTFWSVRFGKILPNSRQTLLALNFWNVKKFLFLGNWHFFLLQCLYRADELSPAPFSWSIFGNFSGSISCRNLIQPAQAHAVLITIYTVYEIAKYLLQKWWQIRPHRHQGGWQKPVQMTVVC